MFEYAYLIWIVIVAIALIVEIFTAELLSIWFVFGGLIALASSFYVDSIGVQFAIFIVSSLATLIPLRSYAIRRLRKKIVKTNVDSIIGQIGLCSEEFNPTTKLGRVKVSGLDWLAHSNDMIKVGDEVMIESVSGVKLEVSKKQNMEDK